MDLTTKLNVISGILLIIFYTAIAGFLLGAKTVDEMHIHRQYEKTIHLQVPTYELPDSLTTI